MGFFVGQHKYLQERGKIAQILAAAAAAGVGEGWRSASQACLVQARPPSSTPWRISTRRSAATPASEPNLAVVKVPDERLDKLSELFQPRKHTPAEVRFIDIAGVAKDMGQDSRAALLAHLRTVDVLLQVVGAFQPERDPLSDFEEFSLELQLADLGQIEKREDRLEKELRLGSKGTPQERTAKERELEVLQRLRPVLEAGQPVRSVELSADEQRAVSSFGFLTQKPTLVVPNLGDEQDGSAVLDRCARVACQHAERMCWRCRRGSRWSLAS